jgi:hypothetical protein
MSLSSRDFSSSSSDSEVLTSNVTTQNEIKVEKFLKKDEKISDFEKRRRKLRERLKFNCERVLLEAEKCLISHKEAFRFDKEIAFQINQKYKGISKIQKKMKLIDYYKLNLKNWIKDYLRTEIDITQFSNDIYVIKRQVILQNTINEMLKHKYLHVYINTSTLKDKEIEIESSSEITLFKNFSVENCRPVSSINSFIHRRNTLHKYLLDNAIKQNKKYMNAYLSRDLYAIEPDDALKLYSDNENFKRTEYERIMRKTQKNLANFCSDDSDSLRCKSPTTKFKKSLNKSGGVIKRLNRQVTKNNFKNFTLNRGLSILADPQYFETKLTKTKSKRKKM